MPTNSDPTRGSQQFFDTGEPEPTWRDWLAPGVELMVGLVLLVLSWEWFWETTGAVWENWHKIVGTISAFLCWILIFHAGNRHGAQPEPNATFVD